MSLTGPQFNQLQKALLSAFPTHLTLAQMVRFGLSESLVTIAGTGNLADVVFNLITWAEAQSRVEELVTQSLEANPRNTELGKWAELNTQTSGSKTNINLPSVANPFQTTGGLSFGSPSYVERTCDSTVMNLFRNTRFISLYGGPQTGKSSLLFRMRGSLSNNWNTIFMDFDGMRTDKLALFTDEFFGIIKDYTQINITTWSELLAHLRSNQTVFLLDEFGKLSSPVAEEFIAHLHWLGMQAHSQICIIVALPRRMSAFCKEKEVHNPKYHQCWASVDLPHFTWDNIEVLLGKLPTLAATIARQYHTDIMKLSSGHPCKVQCLCSKLFSATQETEAETQIIQLILNQESYEPERY